MFVDCVCDFITQFCGNSYFDEYNNQNLTDVTKNNKISSCFVGPDFYKIATEWKNIEWTKVKFDGHKVSIDLPQKIKNAKNVIYVFRNTDSDRYHLGDLGKLLIGFTGTTLGERISSYVSCINDTSSEETSDFLNDIRVDPWNFEVGILYQAAPHEELNDLEKQFIEYFGQSTDLYNQNGGGGGGTVRSKEVPKPYYIIDPNTITPLKSYNISLSDDGHISIEKTPGWFERIKSIKSIKDPNQVFAYQIRCGEKVYEGTSGDPNGRSNTHRHQAQWFDSELSDNLLYATLNEALKENIPCKIGIMPLWYTKPPKELTKGKEVVVVTTAKGVEKTLMVGKKALHRDHPKTGLNMRDAGGGGIHRQNTFISKKRVLTDTNIIDSPTNKMFKV